MVASETPAICEPDLWRTSIFEMMLRTRQSSTEQAGAL